MLFFYPRFKPVCDAVLHEAQRTGNKGGCVIRRSHPGTDPGALLCSSCPGCTGCKNCDDQLTIIVRVSVSLFQNCLILYIV